MKSRIILASLLLAAAASAQPGATRPQAQAQAPADDAVDPSQAEPSHGPEATKAKSIMLQEVISIAVRVAPDLARARIDRTAAVDQAAAARHTQSWTMTASFGYSANGISDQVEAPPYSVVEQDTLSGSLGLGRNLPTGGSITFNTGLQHQHTEYSLLDTTMAAATGTSNSTTGTGTGSASSSANSNLPASEDAFNVQSSLGVTYKQPLVRGFGSIAIADIKKADLGATEATLKAQLAAEDLLKDLVTSYWELAYTSYEVDVRYQGLELAKKQDELAHEQIRAGAASPTTANSVAYEILTRQEAALRSELDLEQKSMELREKAGLEVSARDVVLRPGEPLEIGKDEFDIDAILERSRIANRKLATIQIQKKLADLDVDVAADLAKPQIDLSVSAALLGQADNAGDAVAGIGDRDAYQISAGLSMSFELSGAARKAKDAALAKRRRLDVDRADVERQIEVQTALAVKQVSAARFRVELETKAIEVAEDNVRNERNQFLAGKTTNHNVMQRQGELIDARLKRGRAVCDYHIAVAQLQYLSGLLLEQYGVDVTTHERD